MPAEKVQEQQIINDILDLETPLSERSISAIFSLATPPTNNADVNIGTQDHLGSPLSYRRNPMMSPTGRNRMSPNGPNIESPQLTNNGFAQSTPRNITRLQRLNPGLNLNTTLPVEDNFSSTWFDHNNILTPMTPQIVRSPFDSNFHGLSSPSYGVSSPSYGSTSIESGSPLYDSSFGDLNSPSDSQNGSGGEFFAYNNHNSSMTPPDSSNADNISDLIASLSLDNQGLVNLQNLANFNAFSSTHVNGNNGYTNNGNYSSSIDPVSLFAAHQYANMILEKERKQREIQDQLAQYLLAALMNNNDQPRTRPSSNLTSPMNSPRSRMDANSHRMSPEGSSFGNNIGSCDLGGLPSTLDIAARQHRTSASSQKPQKSWIGELPLRTDFSNEILSNKVFLGGVPWDTPEYVLVTVFSQFGNVKVEWPQGTAESPTAPKGFAYLVFENYTSVKSMLERCAFDGNSYYFKIPSKKRARDNSSNLRNFKDIEIVPWAITDSNWSLNASSTKLEPGKTIFVGALHGRLTAQALYNVMNDLFGDVVYAGIDTDKHKYPIGSGRVTFSSDRAYTAAIRAAFIEVKFGRISKKLQIDPYLEDNMCSECQTHSGPYFCREGVCYRYFCRACWLKVHIGEDYCAHEPIVRNARKSSPPSSPTNPATLNSFNSNLFTPRVPFV